MNSKRSMWKLLLGVVGVGLLVTNCTVKTESDTGCNTGTKKPGCDCTGNVTGYQSCLDDGTYGACVCPQGTAGNSSGGGSNAAGAMNSSAGKGGGTAEGGTSSAGEGGASAAGEGGAGGDGTIVVDPNDCYDCLTKLCTMEWDACAAEDEDHPEASDAPGNYCLSSKIDGSGQIESVLACVEAERAKGLVKRDAVRACGASLGKSSDPSFFLWPPTEMTGATAGLVNCMADAPDEVNPGTWADSTNIPTSGSPKPWADMTCAKLSCTSAKLP